MSFILQLPAHIGQTPGLALDAQNRLVLFHRSGRVWDEYSFNEKNIFNSSLGAIPNNTIALVDSETGKLVEEHGKGQFYMPHGLTIDGQGNLWVTDVGSHQVVKMDSKFNPLMTIGEKMVPG
jgi:peptidylamidoglycolate lyase